MYRVARSRLTHFKFEYFPSAIAYCGWREEERTPFRMVSRNGSLERAAMFGTVISCFGDIAWPARSPDITVPDFFLWGFLKDRVFRRRIMTIQELK